MADGRDEEDQEPSEFSVASLFDERVVEMPDKPGVHGKVPESPVLLKVLAVPPGLGCEWH